MSLTGGPRWRPGPVGSPLAFDIDAAPEDPAALAVSWVDQAALAGAVEPRAVTLATVDADGAPDARIVSLAGIEADGAWRFAGETRGAKGEQLAATPEAAIVAYWPSSARQIRVRGVVGRAPEPESAEDLAARGDAARRTVAAGPQGEPVASEADLTPADDDAPVPPGAWARWRLRPTAVEFWQGSDDRLHRRLRYVRAGDGSWTRSLVRP